MPNRALIRNFHTYTRFHPLKKSLRLNNLQHRNVSGSIRSLYFNFKVRHIDTRADVVQQRSMSCDMSCDNAVDHVDVELLTALKQVVNDCKWIHLGEASLMAKVKCRRLYCEEGDDVVLITPDRGLTFYALDASCPHEGGPLDQGDIEDIDGKITLYCPWHMYDFNVADGTSSSGLVQDVYEVKVVDGQVYVHIDRDISLHKSQKPTKVPAKEPGQSSEILDSAAKLKIDATDTETHDDSLTYWAVKILNTPEPDLKAKLTLDVGRRWREGEITIIGNHTPPHEPQRHSKLTVVAPGKIKSPGKGVSKASKISNLHSMANIEQWAVDLTWDVIARFAFRGYEHKSRVGRECDSRRDSIVCLESGKTIVPKMEGDDMKENILPPPSEDFQNEDNLPSLPKEFFDDFVQVAVDEAKHFSLLSERLTSLDSHYGALPVHNALWSSAIETHKSLLGRLAIVHMVHEARGLDVQPSTLLKFHNNNDKESCDILKVIYEEEITHVAAGLRWFSFCCQHHSPPINSIETFHQMVKTYFRGYLKPPFNTEGRTQAGMGPEWYTPLTKPKS